MMVDVPAATGGFLVEPAPGGNIHLTADDRLDALVPGGLIKINRAIEHAVVGYRQRGEFEVVGLLHERLEATRAIEQRVFGVQMKMDKIRVRHRSTLTSLNQTVQGAEPKSYSQSHGCNSRFAPLPPHPSPLPWGEGEPFSALENNPQFSASHGAKLAVPSPRGRGLG